jgi:hypothetical protein
MISGDRPVKEPPDRKVYETKDLSFKGLMLTAAGILGLMGLIFLISWGLYRVFQYENPGLLDSPFTEPTTLPAEPRLQPNPEIDLRAFTAAQDSMLSSYGWVNRDSGFVRVPVDTAIEMVLKEGLPSRNSSRNDSLQVMK